MFIAPQSTLKLNPKLVFASGTRIRTEQGLKSIEDIRVWGEWFLCKRNSSTRRFAAAITASTYQYTGR